MVILDLGAIAPEDVGVVGGSFNNEVNLQKIFYVKQTCSDATRLGHTQSQALRRRPKQGLYLALQMFILPA